MSKNKLTIPDCWQRRPGFNYATGFPDRTQITKNGGLKSFGISVKIKDGTKK